MKFRLIDIKNILVLNILILNAVSCTQYTVPISGVDIETRILLAEGKNFKIIPKNSYVLSLDNQSILMSGPLNIQFHQQGIQINGKVFAVNNLNVQGIKAFKVNNKIFRGSFSVYREKYKLGLINKVHLEEYLLSVVPSESYASWSYNALKAQAVASRTYALYEIKRNRKDPSRKFDLYADTRSQVYHGVKSENKRTSKAVLSTAGVVMMHNGQLIKSYFSSSVGGISADGSEIGDAKPYLKSVPTKISSKNPLYSWSMQVSLPYIEKKFKTRGSIKSIGVQSRTLSGRINQIQIKDSSGKSTVIGGEKFRKELGYSKMKSTLAQINVNSGKLVIRGKGYGHGVGMGQWEAEELGKRGVPYNKILTYFYQGTELVRIY